MNLKVLLLISAVILLAWARFKIKYYKTKDSILVKEDELLKNKADSVRSEIDKLKVEVPTQPMTPEAVEGYWNDNAKKS